MEYVKIFIFE